MKRLSRFSALVVSLFVIAILGSSTVMAQGTQAPLARLVTASGKAIPDEYIVVLNAGADARAEAGQAGINPKFVYSAALNGFAAKLTARQLEAVRRNPKVAYVEQDQAVTVDTTQPMDINGDPWGLDRIDQRNLPLSNSYTYTPTGAGVRAYIIDTGIQANHPDFGVRGSNAWTYPGGSVGDCHGHGTHVAGTVGGTTWGVAKAVLLLGIKVLDCAGSGTTANVIAGVDWVTANAIKPAVANMSLGGGFSAALNTSATNLINSGVFLAVAAGNSYGANACLSSPSSVPTAVTVAASTKTDTVAPYSNLGSCVDIFAPGSAIKSAWIGSGTNNISGTSMASPHVAGCAALHLQTNGSVPPASVTNWLINNSTINVLTGVTAPTPNKLLYCYKPDVWIKDKPVDTGLEPDPATAALNMWESQDIWVRHLADGVYSHQNPEFGQTNFAYARLRNRGMSPGTGTAIFYIANASAGLGWAGSWTAIGSVAVTNLAPGATLDVNVPWSPPGTGHYCMIVRWVSSQEPMTYTETWDVNYNTRYNNNIAWRNMNVVNLMLIGTPIRNDLILRNIFRRELGDPQTPTVGTLTSVSFRQQGGRDAFLNNGTVTVDLGKELFERWKQGGAKGTGVVQVGETQLQIKDLATARLDGIFLQPDEAFSIGLIFEAKTPATTTSGTYTIAAIQSAEGRQEPLGGVTYEVTLPKQ